MAGHARGLLLAGAVALSACGDDARSGSGGASLTTVVTASKGAPASALPLDQGVEATAGSGEFAVISAATEVAAGDRVRTDSTGFAEISYIDGSLTRLDVDTEFEIVGMSETEGVATTRTSLEVGRVWNRVQTLGSEGEFSVETSVATATVRGTAFLVDCRLAGSCTFTVFEGAIEIFIDGVSVLVLEAPGSVTVDAAGVGEPVVVPLDAAAGDQWVVDNATRDVAAGFAETVALAPGGTYAVVITVGSFYDPIPSNPVPPNVTESFLEFAGVCDGVGPCTLLLDLNNFDLDGSLLDLVTVGGVALTPLGAGSYGTTIDGPYSDFCPISTTVEFAVTLTASAVTGSYSQTPETREILTHGGGSQCWASTFDLTFSGTRPA